MKTKKIKFWDYLPAQTLIEWEEQYKRLLGQAYVLTEKERKDSINKPLFKAIFELKNFLKSNGVKFI